MKFIVPILILLTYLLGNVYVFQRIWTAMPPNWIGKTALISFAVIVILSMLLAFLASSALPIGVAVFVHKVGTGWMFVVLFLFIVFLLQDLLGLANRWIHFVPNDALSRYTRDSWVGFGFIVGFVALFMLCGYLKYQWKVRVPVAFTIDKPLVNSTTRQLRVAAISDLHLGYGISKKEFEGWIEIINKEQPDIVIIAGDIIDSSVRPLIEGGYANSFKKFNAPVYACLGNHEYISGIKESLDFLNQTGITILRDSVTLVNDAYYIVGRDDKWNTHRKELSDLVKDVDFSKPVIMLDHQPFHLEVAEQNNIDVQFSGHTHQGQVWPISLITKGLYEMDHGFMKRNNTLYMVSSGIGIWGGKFRIGTQSEYMILDIEFKK